MGNNLIEQVKSYKYPGVEFHFNHNWNKTVNNRINSTINTFHNIWAPLFKMKFSDINLAFKLFDQQILPKLLYGVPVWGIGRFELLERLQTTFIKKMMSLPNHTAGYILRLEFGRYQIQMKAFKRTMGFWAKLIRMDNDRLPKICLNDELYKREATLDNTWVKQCWESRLTMIGLSLPFSINLILKNQWGTYIFEDVWRTTNER